MPSGCLRLADVEATMRASDLDHQLPNSRLRLAVDHMRHDMLYSCRQVPKLSVNNIYLDYVDVFMGILFHQLRNTQKGRSCSRLPVRPALPYTSGRGPR